MSCFAKLSQSVMISESLHDDLHENNLKNYFPNFLWLMRDSDFECKDDNGEEISPTDYLFQKILVTNNTGDKPLSTRDRAVSSIRAIFPKIQCLDIPSPGSGISNPKKEHLIDPDFHTSINKAKRYVVTNTPVKLGFNKSTKLNGPMLATLLHEYVDVLNKPGTVPNLEVSYQKAVEATLTETAHRLAKNYSKQMSYLLDPIPPLEEGDIENLKHTHSVRLEESLNEDILKTCRAPIESVKKTDALFEVHEKVYTDLLKFFTIELHRLIPKAAHTDETLLKDEQTRKRQLLQRFEQLIFTVITDPEKKECLGGYISHFAKLNTEKSESKCKDVFEKIYKCYITEAHTGAPEREILYAEYSEEAVGPAKDKVFQKLSSQIPGPPQNVNLETQILYWEKPLVNADAINSYYIEWQREGGDTKREKTHNNNYFKLEHLKPKTNYSIKVQGFNDSKNRYGEYSAVYTFQTKADKPEKPKMPKIIPKTEETAMLIITMLSEAEQNGSPVSNIIISRCSDKNSTWEVQTFPVDSSQGEFQALEVDITCKNNEQKLWLQVQFKNEAGVSEPSESALLEITDMIPGKPENIKTIAKARQIHVTWDPPINNPGAVNHYVIQCWQMRDDQELSSCESDKKTRHDKRSVLIKSLRPYTKYNIHVNARNHRNNTVTNGYGTLDVQTLADVPDKPHPPTIRVTSAREAMITFYRQKPNEENGSQVNNIAIEQQTKHKEQATKWTVVKEHLLIDSGQSDKSNLSVPVELINFTEPCISCYRVVTVNSIGRSEPSQAVEVHPESIIPGSPERLKETTIESNSITISWKKPKVNPLVSKQYQIKYKEVEGKKWSLEKANASGIRSYEVSELRPNTEYTFTVQALNETLMSEEATLLVRTPPSVPAKPKPPIVTPEGEEFTLKAHLPPVKDSGREVTHLHVHYYGKSCDSPQKTIDYIVEHQASVQNNSHEQQVQLNIDDTCWISISLSNEVGESQESDLVAISPADVIPGFPDKLECTPDARNVKLSWNVPQKNGNAAKHYEVLIKNTKNQKWETKNVSIHQKRLNETLSYEATVNDLSPITTYHLGVRAINNTSRIGNISELVARTTSAPPDKPLKPIAVEPITGDPLRANLKLKMLSKEQMNGSAVESVIIECEFNKKPVELTAEQQVENTSTMLEIDLPNLRDPKIKTYSFCIRMKNGEGESPPSDAFMLPISELQPGSPKNIKISEITAHTLKVQWEEPAIHPALVTHYNIEYNAVQTDRFDKNTITVKSEVKEYIISKLRSYQQYCIKVIATAAKHSEPIQTNAITKEIYPGAPTSLMVEKISDISVKVGWRKPKERPEEVCFYKVELREGNCTNAAKANISEVKNERRSLGYSTVFENLDPFTTYTVSVSSYNNNNATHTDAMECLTLSTKMSTPAKVALGILSAPTVVGPIIIAITQARDENINPSDDEFDDELDTHTSAAEN
ncbi:titin-like isoform X2 [Halichondria panicea]